MMHQFSVRLKNEPGALAMLAERLADRDIDIRAIGAVVVGKDGYTVFTTNNDAATREVLRGARYGFTEGEVVSTYVEDRAGSLARTTRKLAADGVNIQSVLVIGRRQGKVELAFTLDDVAKGKRALGLS